MAEAFIVEVEEGLVAEDGAADAGSILVLAQFGLGSGVLEEITAVEDIVAEVLVDGAVELVGSGSSDDVDDAACGTASLWSIAVGFDRDLVNTFDVWLNTDGPDHAFVIVDTVDDPVVEALVLSVDGEAGGVGAAIIWTATTAERVARTWVGARDEVHELNEVTTVQRKVLHGLGGDGGAYSGVVSLEERGLCSYFDDSVRGTRLKVNIVAGAVTSFYREVLGNGRLETIGFDRNRVVSDGEKGEVVIPGGVADSGALLVGSEVGKRNTRVGNDCARGVCDGAEDISGGQLREAR